MAELLSILMQRSDPAHPWGFAVRSNEVSQVTSGTLAALHLSSGDKILEINNIRTRQMSQDEVDALINNPSKTLDLLVVKGSTLPPSADLKDSRSGNTQIYQGRGGSVDSWDSGTAQTDETKNHKATLDQTQGVLEESSVRQWRSRYDQWLNSGDHSPRRHALEQRKQLRDQRSSKGHSDLYKTEHLDDGRVEHLSRRQMCGRDSQDKNTAYNEHDQGTPSSKQGGNGNLWHIPQVRYTTPSDLKLKNRRSLNIEDLKKNGFDTKMDVPHFIGKEAKSNSWFTARNSDSINPTCSTEHDQNVRKRWSSPQNPLSESMTKSSSSRSEFTKYINTVNESYSKYDGANKHEKHEAFNVTKETEEHVKIVDGNEEEITKKTSKNKEYTLTNKDIVNGEQNETKRTVNDYTRGERVIINKEKDFSNTIKNQTEDHEQYNPTKLQEKTSCGIVIEDSGPLQAEYYKDSVIPDEYERFNNTDIDSTDGSSIYFTPTKKSASYDITNMSRDRIPPNIKDSMKTDVWGPRFTGRTTSQPKTNWSPLDDRQGDLTFWEVSPDRKSNRSSNHSKTHKRNNSDFSYGYSSLTSDCSLPNSEQRREELKNDQIFNKIPTEYFIEDFKGLRENVPQRGKIKIPAVFCENIATPTENESTKCLSSIKKDAPIEEESNTRKTVTQNNKQKETEPTYKGLVNQATKNEEHSVGFNFQKEYGHTNDKEEDPGVLSQIRKFIDDFQTADRMSREENKKCLDFVDTSRDSTNMNDIQNCDFRIPTNDEYAKSQRNLNEYIPENHRFERNLSSSCPLLPETVRNDDDSSAKYSSDLEDSVFNSSSSITHYSNDIPMFDNRISTKRQNQFFQHREQHTEGFPSSQNRPSTQRDDVLRQPTPSKCVANFQIGPYVVVDDKRPESPKTDPFKFWGSTARNQSNQNHLVHLMSPRPFLSINENTTQSLPPP